MHQQSDSLPVLSLSTTQHDAFRDELIREWSQAAEYVGDIVLARGAVGAAEELEETQPGAPPVGVEGVVGGELGVGGFRGSEGAVGCVGVEEVGAGGRGCGEGGEDEVEVVGYEIGGVGCELDWC